MKSATDFIVGFSVSRMTLGLSILFYNEIKDRKPSMESRTIHIYPAQQKRPRRGLRKFYKTKRAETVDLALHQLHISEWLAALRKEESTIADMTSVQTAN